MIRPGVRCARSHPAQGVETTGADCIGRVVQLTTHARAIYGVSIDDRVAALFPFEYTNECNGSGSGGVGGVGSNGGSSGRRNNRYSLVDAGFVVTVPKNVDAAEAACMTRLYMTAFQSIQLGMNNPRDRYDLNLLKGQSILVQNGNTELGQALIEVAAFLGASHIFATALLTEHHPVLRKLGAIPLGAQTFGWELFISEKLGLVMLQELPSAEEFESFISILDERKGNMVLAQEKAPNDGDDNISIMIKDVECDTVYFKDLADKARAAVNTAKFHLRLSCSPQFLTYEGVWPSSKTNQSMFKEDLRFLFTLLDSGNLKPNVNERICLEEVQDVQDRIELHGKQGTIVCLPFKTATETALYEKKAFAPNVVSPHNRESQDDNREAAQHYDLKVHQAERELCNTNDSGCDTNVTTFNYEVDAGYVTPKQLQTEGLSDFHTMGEANKKQTRGTRSDNHSMTFPKLQSHPITNFVSISDMQQNPFPDQQEAQYTMMPNSAKSYELPSSDYHCTTSSVPGSVGQTVVSDGIIKQTAPSVEQDHPNTILFHDKKLNRRNRAFQRQKEAKERWKKSQLGKMSHSTKDDDSVSTLSHSSEKAASSTPFPPEEKESTTAWRKHRRDIRMKTRGNESPRSDLLITPALSSVNEQYPMNKCHSIKVSDDEASQMSVISSSSTCSPQAQNKGNDDEGKTVAPLKNGLTVCPTRPRQRSAEQNQPRSKETNHLLDDQTTDSHFAGKKYAIPLQTPSEQKKDESPNASSFRSLMSKWKSIDENGLGKGSVIQ